MRALLALMIVVAAVASGCANDTASRGTDRSVPVTTTTSGPPKVLEVTAAAWRAPAPVAREVLLTDGTALFVLGGIDGAQVSTASVTRIDPKSGTSREIARLDPAVHDAAGARLKDELLVIAGGTPPTRTTVQSVATNGTVRTVGNLPEPRADHVAAVVRGSVSVFGGGDEAATLLGSVVASGDGIAWRQAGRLAEAVRYPAVAVVGDQVYLFGGVVTSAGQDTRSIQRYDPGTGATTVVAQVPAPLSHAMAVVLGDSVYVVGGFVDNKVSDQILRFDPATGAVTVAGRLTAGLTDAAAVVLDEVGYVVGGQGTDRKPVASVLLLRLR